MTRVAPLGAGIAVHISVPHHIAAKQLGLSSYLVLTHPSLMNGYIVYDVLMPVDNKQFFAEVNKKITYPFNFDWANMDKARVMFCTLDGPSFEEELVTFGKKCLKCVGCKNELKRLVFGQIGCYNDSLENVTKKNKGKLHFISQGCCNRGIMDEDLLYYKILGYGQKLVFGKNVTPYPTVIEHPGGFTGMVDILAWSKTVKTITGKAIIDLEVLNG